MGWVLENIVKFITFVWSKDDLIIWAELDACILVVRDLSRYHRSNPYRDLDSGFLFFLVVVLGVHVWFKFYNTSKIRSIINSFELIINLKEPAFILHCLTI